MRPIYPFPLHLALAGSLAAWAVRAAGSVPALCALLALCAGLLVRQAARRGARSNGWFLLGLVAELLVFCGGNPARLLDRASGAMDVRDSARALFARGGTRELEEAALVLSSGEGRFGGSELLVRTGSGELLLRTKAGPDSLPEPGDRIRARWRRRPLDPESFRDRALAERVAAGTARPRGELLSWIPEPDAPALPERLAAGTARFRAGTLRAAGDALERRLGKAAGGAALAVLLGERGGLSEEQSRDLRDAGLFHLFAISGMHLALLANILLVLLRAAGLGARGCSGALIALLWAYAWLCGFPVSVRRAAIMATASLSGPWFARRSAPFHSLALACWILLLTAPGDFASPAFFLSFGATAGIVAWNSKSAASILPDNPLAAPLGISVSAFLATLPLLVLFFNQANPWTLLANLPACPLTALFFGSSLGAAVCDPWCGPLADAFGGSAFCIYKILTWTAELAAKAPFGKTAVAAWPVAVVLLWYAAYFAFSRWRSGPAARRIALASTALLLAWWAPQPLLQRLFPEARIDVIDVGQGDAILFTAPNGRRLLVDAGPGGADGRRLVRHLLSRGGAPDLMIVTHPHADHWGGLPAMAENRLLPPRILVAKGTTKRPSRSYLKALDLARSGGAAIDSLSEATVALDPTVRVRVRQPGRSARPVNSANDLTLVSEIGLGCAGGECENWVVLTGDLENRPELLYAALPSPGPVALLKVGHHGAKSATSDALLETLKPERAAISVGTKNKYRHPTPQALGRLARRGIAADRTDGQGSLRYLWRPGKRLSLSAD